MEVNVDYVSACLVDLAGEVLVTSTLAGDNRRRRGDLVVSRAASAASACIASPAAAGRPLAGVGVALPGLVDSSRVLRRAPNLPALEGEDVGARLLEALGREDLAVVADNEANLAALAELVSNGEARRDFVLVSGEIGVGAGIVVAGEIFRGVRGLAGEIGHVLVDPAGPPCSCGARGCLEQVAGQEALLAGAGISTVAGPAGRALAARAGAGDLRALAAIERAGEALGVALASLVNLLDVPAVVLGGIYSELSPWLAAALAAELDRRVVARSFAPVELRTSSLGGAAARGAGVAALRWVLDDPASWRARSLAAG